MSLGHALETWTDENTQYSEWYVDETAEMLFSSGVIEREISWQKARLRLADIQNLGDDWDEEEVIYWAYLNPQGESKAIICDDEG